MFLAVAVMVGLAIFQSEKRPLAIVALSAVFIGLAVSAAASVIGVGFDTLAPHYNLWLSHGVVLVGAAAFAVPSLGKARVAAVAGVILLFVNLMGEARLLVHPEHFNHGPQGEIEALIQAADQQSLAIVHDPVSWGWSYFPLRFVHGAGLPQFRSSPDGRTLIRIGADASALPVSRLSQRFVLVVSTSSLTTDDIAHDLAGSPVKFPANPLVAALGRDGSWKLLRGTRHVSQVGGEAALFELTQSGTTGNAKP
jgi:hypothetical protein